jgi:hypothetical protein
MSGAGRVSLRPEGRSITAGSPGNKERSASFRSAWSGTGPALDSHVRWRTGYGRCVAAALAVTLAWSFGY